MKLETKSCVFRGSVNTQRVPSRQWGYSEEITCWDGFWVAWFRRCTHLPGTTEPSQCQRNPDFRGISAPAPEVRRRNIPTSKVTSMSLPLSVVHVRCLPASVVQRSTVSTPIVHRWPFSIPKVPRMDVPSSEVQLWWISALEIRRWKISPPEIMSMALPSSIVTMLSVSSSIAERMLLYICKGRPRMPLEIKGKWISARKVARVSLLSMTLKGRRRIIPVPPGSKPFFLAPTVETKTVLFILSREFEIYTPAYSSLITAHSSVNIFFFWQSSVTRS